MGLNENSIKQIKLSLKQLSDIEFQKRVWLRGQGTEVSSYTEVVCQLFDDSALGYFLEKKQDIPVLSEELDMIFLELSKILDKIDYKMGTKAIIEHPEWHRVRRLSAEALKLLGGA